MVPVVPVLGVALIGQLAQSSFLPIASSQIVPFLLEGKTGDLETTVSILSALPRAGIVHCLSNAM